MVVSVGGKNLEILHRNRPNSWEFFEREDIVRALGKMLVGRCGKHFRRFEKSALYAVRKTHLGDHFT